MNLINQYLYNNFGIKNNSPVHDFGMVDTKKPNSISFLNSKKYLNTLNENKNISAVFINKENSSLVKNKTLIIVEEPIISFYKLFNEFGSSLVKKKKNKISGSVKINPTAFIDSFNISIGSNTIIEPNVVIHNGVEIGNNCKIRSGTVIGSEGFEYKRTNNNEILSVSHYGKVIIGNNVEIGPLNVIDKGLYFRDTILENDVKTDNLVHIAHGVKVGEKTFIAAASMIAGNVDIGNSVWIGPNSTISNRIKIRDKAEITLGSVVVRNVKKHEKVSGNFAIPHLEFLKKIIK